MDETVPLADVLLVLTAKLLSISATDVSIHRYIIAGNGGFEEITFTDPVGKKRLRYLSLKFGIPIYLFWHPEMLNFNPGENPN